MAEDPDPEDSLDPPCVCFLGMVKLLLVTLRAPVTWILDPGGPGDGKTGIGGGGGPGFLDLGVLVWGGVGGGGCFFALFAEVLPLGAA